MSRFNRLVVLAVAVAMLAGIGCNRVAPVAKAIPYLDESINGASKTVTRMHPAENGAAANARWDAAMEREFARQLAEAAAEEQMRQWMEQQREYDR